MEGISYEEVRYEGYGPGGTAIMVDCLTDNRNRTVGEVRHALTKAGGNLGTDGSVSYMFNKLGIISYSDSINEDAVMEAAMEAGADDIVTHDDGSVDVITSPDDYLSVKEAMVAAGFDPGSAEVTQTKPTPKPRLNLSRVNPSARPRTMSPASVQDTVEDTTRIKLSELRTREAKTKKS